MERNDHPDTEVAHAIKPGAALKAHRTGKRCSLAEAGERAGLRASSASKFKNDKTEATLDGLRRMSVGPKTISRYSLRRFPDARTANERGRRSTARLQNRYSIVARRQRGGAKRWLIVRWRQFRSRNAGEISSRPVPDIEQMHEIPCARSGKRATP